MTTQNAILPVNPHVFCAACQQTVRAGLNSVTRHNNRSFSVEHRFCWLQITAGTRKAQLPTSRRHGKRWCEHRAPDPKNFSEVEPSGRRLKQINQGTQDLRDPRIHVHLLLTARVSTARAADCPHAARAARRKPGQVGKRVNEELLAPRTVVAPRSFLIFDFWIFDVFSFFPSFFTCISFHFSCFVFACVSFSSFFLKKVVYIRASQT